MNRYFNNKGQADTVFEVLIAVILLGFVLTMGIYAMNTLSNNKCSKTIDLKLNELVSNIEISASGTLVSKDFFFRMDNCFGTQYSVQMQKQSGGMCSSYCLGSTDSCYLLKYENPKDKVSQVRFSCINISPSLQINPTSCGETIGNNNNVDFNNGEYNITNSAFSTGSTLPYICIKKVDS